MNKEELKKLLIQGEGEEIEFKTCKDALSKSVFDTVSAFSNKNGGHLILGIGDNGEVLGVDKTKVKKIVNDFLNSIHDSTKINPPLFIEPEVIDFDDKKIIYIYVPVGVNVCWHNGRIFERSFEGDVDITNKDELVWKLFQKKKSICFVNKVYPNLSINDLDKKVINKARKMAIIRNQNHLWKNLNDEEMLKSAGLILKDPETNKEGITIAAILLFGKDQTIMSVLPQYRTDAIFRVKNKDRYDDREIVATNLIDSYEKLINFGEKHLSDIFVLDGIVSVSARNLILREIISNTLAHRKYASNMTATIVIDENNITVENDNSSSSKEELDPKTFRPNPKNPPISKVFREIGLADELGSGIRKTYKYTKLYSNNKPTFLDSNIFKTIIPIPKIATLKVGKMTSNIDTDNKNITNKKQLNIERIFNLVKENSTIKRSEIAAILNLTEKTISRYIREIKNIKYVGKGKNGYWEIIDK
ncbi:Divergent AAA domain (plasmid) [Mesomycoplasma conjunctivae]|nr:RNA-binding domain-containing protein [Mycoplasmopsis fermentans]ADV34785.1 Transcriptional regulator [Mycoplasmopsis fermentans M64]VEU63754.1 Divergent AAA domain [Mycoplasmopsis fermentans]VEU67257.1 Divergent AAA domain [Mesomycoplasma conjunctivae]